MTGPARARARCRVCGVRPPAMAWVEFCFTCWPGGPVAAPPCLRCGSSRLFWAAGLCMRCHPGAIPPPDSCTGYLAWGATRNLGWRCNGCAAWCRKYTRTRAPNTRTAFDEVARGGLQLFIADLFSSRRRGASIPASARSRPLPAQPPAHRQLPLFAAALSHRALLSPFTPHTVPRRPPAFTPPRGPDFVREKWRFCS